MQRMPRCGKRCFFTLSMQKYFVIVINKYFFVENDKGLYPVQVILTDNKSKLKGFNRFNIDIVNVLPRNKRSSNREMVIFHAPNTSKVPTFTKMKKSSNGIYATKIAQTMWIEGKTMDGVTRASTVVTSASPDVVNQ